MEMQPTNPAPPIGIHQKVPYAVYSSWPAVRSSDLKHHADTDAHALIDQLAPPKDKSAFTMGRAFHTASLEPELLERDFAVAPRVMVDGVLTGDKRLKAVKLAWAELEAEQPHAEILSEKDYHQVLSWRDAVWGHPVMAEILGSPGFNEASIVWEDPATGLLCKARIDAMRLWCGHTVVIDLKSDRDGSPRGFAKAISDYHYPAQGAHYLNGLTALAPAERRFMWFTVDKATSLPAIYEPDFATLEYGKRQNATWLKRRAQCLATNEWPGFPAGVNTISLPEWKFRQEEDDDDGSGF
jgi:exodeoxyribonuclease VIII